MVHTHRPPTDSARITGLVAVLVLLFSALSAGAAVAASPVAGSSVAGSSSPDGAPVVGTTTATGASAPAPSGFIVSSAPSGPVAAPAPAHTAAPVARSQPTIIAPNSGDAAVGRPSHQAERPVTSQVTVVSSVVATASAPPVKPAVVQLDSAGPLVASAVGRPPAATVGRRQPAVAAMLRGLPLFPTAPPAARTASVSVAVEGVYLSASTSARRPGQRPLAPVAGPLMGPAGLGSVSLGSPWGPGSSVRDGWAWLGNAPLSSSGPTGVSLLGATAVLAAMTLLAAVTWRRGPWVWPELGFQSLLCSAVLDRPG